LKLKEKWHISRKYDAGSNTAFQNIQNPLDIYEYFSNYSTCEHIAEQTGLYAQQKINERTQFNKIKSSSQDKDWVPTNKNYLQLPFEILSKSLKLAYISLIMDSWKRVFHETMSKVIFFVPFYFTYNRFTVQ
jgi:hypothetical protein